MTEALRIGVKKYRKTLKGKATVKKCNRTQYLKNQQARCAYQRAYRLRNKENVALGLRRWVLNNYGRVLAACAMRRALKRKATIGDLVAIGKIYNRAQELRQWFNVVVDHIIPLNKGGMHSPDNLQIIYATENIRKLDRLDYQSQVVFI